MAIVQDMNKSYKYKYKAKTAKLNRDIFKSIGNGSLNLSSSSIHIMTYVAKYIDGIDGRIYVNMEQVRKDLFMQPDTFKRAISELMQNEMLLFNDGFYYSGFHVLSNGGTKESFYLRMLNAYTSPEVLNLSKNQQRLFYYIATMGMVGVYKTVNVENLYKNCLHDTRYGIQYFDSYRDFADALFELIEKGLVSVWLVNENKFINHTTSQFKEAFHTYCENDIEGRKKRTSANRMHKIALKINDSIANDVSHNCANEAEFNYFAEQYQIVHQFIKIETKRYFINLKNVLTHSLGVAGLVIYRTALETYFRENEEMVLYYDMQDKAANYFKDFYLLKEVEKIIVGALTSACGEKGALAAAVNYPIQKELVDKLISFYSSEASPNHLICLDSDIESSGVSWLKIINQEAEFWKDLYDKIQDIYRFYCLQFTTDISKDDLRSFARMGLLTQREELKKAVNEMKKTVRILPLHKKSPSENDYGKPATFKPDDDFNFTDKNGKLINWLDW
ncbi:hypothetical protein P9265_14975 [Schinkia azotoformans]|uniref:hypothetical protein n=1 Tax=Schinkia azotoformans TaxID=1454 RepID=UPI002E21F3D8|nr:hypothetical protein [Schinkia azotoformans]